MSCLRTQLKEALVRSHMDFMPRTRHATSELGTSTRKLCARPRNAASHDASCHNEREQLAVLHTTVMESIQTLSTTSDLARRRGLPEPGEAELQDASPGDLTT